MRFPNYHECLVEKRFSELAYFKKGPFGSALKKEIFVPKSDTTIKVYEQQNAIYKDWELERYFITSDYYDKMKSFTVNPGDIIVSCAGTIGEIYTLPMDAEKGVINQALMIVRPNEKIINKDYFIYIFEKMIDNFTLKFSNGSAIKNIPPFADLKNHITNIPSIHEQNKIVAFLSKIDERIETQSKIIEDLELVKKGIYNHIFTQLNNVEKILLEDLLIDFNKRTLTDKQYSILSSTLSGIYLQEEYFNKQAASATTEGYKIVPYGFATYRSMSDTGEFRFNLQTIVENGIVSPAYPVFTCIENYRLDFILFCLNYYDDIKKQLFSMKQGGTRLALHFNSFCKLYIPQIGKEKQSKIMAIVNSYNDKIVVEKQILEKLKEQKKFLLSNMFI